MRRGLLVLLLLAAGSCGLPDRDNPRDPAHRPVPLLLVTDVSKPDGSCPCTLAAGNLTCDASLEGSTVAAASRGRCLALDARESTDPDEALAELDHRFFVLASGGEIELTSPADGVLATNGLFLLGASLRSMLPTETEITFLARTEDPQGNYASDGTVLTLFNSRPELQAPSTRTFPFGGFPWLLDEPAGAPDFDVDFRADGLVTDPDSSDIEHLVYCWTIGPDPEACHRDPAHPDFSRTLPSDQLQVVPAYLRVSDWAGPEAEATAHPETFSNTVRTRVVIGTSPLWIADDDGTFGMERIDPLHEWLSFTGGNAIQSPDPMWAAPLR